MFALGLRIKNKEGEVVRFVLNQAQTKVMEAIHRQLETTGKIRLVIIKSRLYDFIKKLADDRQVSFNQCVQDCLEEQMNQKEEERTSFTREELERMIKEGNEEFARGETRSFNSVDEMLKALREGL